MCENGEHSSIQAFENEVTSAMCELLCVVFIQNCIDLTDRSQCLQYVNRD